MHSMQRICKFCKRQTQYASDMHNMQTICKQNARNMHNILKICSWLNQHAAPSMCKNICDSDAHLSSLRAPSTRDGDSHSRHGHDWHPGRAPMPLSQGPARRHSDHGSLAVRPYSSHRWAAGAAARLRSYPDTHHDWPSGVGTSVQRGQSRRLAGGARPGGQARRRRGT